MDKLPNHTPVTVLRPGVVSHNFTPDGSPAVVMGGPPAAVPSDQVQIGARSSLLDRAKTLSLGASVGLTATVLLDTAALAGAAAAVGTASGLVALVATGLAVVHLGKRAYHHFQGPDTRVAQLAHPAGQHQGFIIPERRVP